MKKLSIVMLLVAMAIPAMASYSIVVEGWNKDFLAFKLAQWHNEKIEVRLVNLPAVGETLIFNWSKTK